MPDNKVLPRARQSLPRTLRLDCMADGCPAVVTKCFIEKGTVFGPFVAKKRFTLDPSILFPLKIFNGDEDDFSEYYLDTTDDNECSWLMFVPPANTAEEQNLMCYQVIIKYLIPASYTFSIF